VILCFCRLERARILEASLESLCCWPVLGQLGMWGDQAFFCLVLIHQRPRRVNQLLVMLNRQKFN
jgi:hypothetical protein